MSLYLHGTILKRISFHILCCSGTEIFQTQWTIPEWCARTPGHEYDKFESRINPFGLPSRRHQPMLSYERGLRKVVDFARCLRAQLSFFHLETPFRLRNAAVMLRFTHQNRLFSHASVGRSPKAFGRSRCFLTNIGFKTLNNSKGNAARQVFSLLPFLCGTSLKAEKSNFLSPEIPSFSLILVVSKWWGRGYI